MKPYNIRIEHGKTRTDRVCIIENTAPIFSWAAASEAFERQAAYRLSVGRKEKTVWDSGWVEKTAQYHRYSGEGLEPGEIYTVSITLRNQKGKTGETARQKFCYGKLNGWDAEWICEKEERKDAVISFVSSFSCDQDVESACLFVCGLGYHKVWLNGQDIFTQPLNPAFSEYEKRCYYTVLPGLEQFLNKGANRLGVRVAGGWRPPDNICYQLTGRIPSFTGRTQLCALLKIRYCDGSVEWKGTDRTWKYFYDGAVSSNLFMGERYDAAKRKKGWSRPETPLEELTEAAIAPFQAITPSSTASMVPQTLEAVCEQEVYAPRTVFQVAEGVWGIDFGQNIAGVCRIRIPSYMSAGQELNIRHMEFLDEENRLYLPQLRNAQSIDTYIAAGDGRDLEYWQPEFTYHGFRYAEVTGYPGPMTKEDIRAVSMYTDIVSGSHFTCGNALVDKIYKNAVQTEKANIHSILTDCPQRDERMGWLNDATVRFEAVPYSFDVGRLFPKVVRDCMDVQSEDGSITCTAPFAFGTRPADPVCSSYLIAGWQAWLHTGNLDIIREGYDGFCRWNQFLERRSENNLVNYSYYGDWAAPAYACASEEFAVSNVTPGEFMSSGYFYYNTCLLAMMANLLGRQDEAAAHGRKADEIKSSFLAKWYDPSSGKAGTGSQGCQSFALWLDILPEEERKKAADYLHRDLVDKKYCFTTGNLCTRYMMESLTRFGYLEDAWELAVREEYPSLGYMVQNEATTIWERFELKKNPTMNSHNHPMYGAVVYWYYAFLAGITPVEGGWRSFRVKPFLPEKLLSASAVVDTPYGDVSVRWVRRYGETHLYVNVPHGTSAEVILPWGGWEIVSNGFHHWKN